MEEKEVIKTILDRKDNVKKEKEARKIHKKYCKQICEMMDELSKLLGRDEFEIKQFRFAIKDRGKKFFLYTRDFRYNIVNSNTDTTFTKYKRGRNCIGNSSFREGDYLAVMKIYVGIKNKITDPNYIKDEKSKVKSNKKCEMQE